jgi:hypothetical protein
VINCIHRQCLWPKTKHSSWRGSRVKKLLIERETEKRREFDSGRVFVAQCYNDAEGM